MSAEVIVVGLGAVGAAVLYQLARRGVPALGIDRFSPPHDRGSSHGETRITRLAVGEGEAFAPLVRRSHEIWRALEAEEGVSLLHRTGGLILGARSRAVHHGRDDFVGRTIAIAQQHGIAHEVLSPRDVMARFSQFRLRGDELIYFEPEAGMLSPEACLRAQIAAARRLRATIRVEERVLSVAQEHGVVRVATERETLHAPRCVVAAGAWIGPLLGDAVARRTRIFRQTLHWFAPEDRALYAPGHFPVFIWMHGEGPSDYFYGFPEAMPGAGVKLATEQYEEETDPDRLDHNVTDSAELFRAHADGRLRGLSAQVLRAEACLYTVTPDSGFIIDEVPGMNRVLAVSACSGHGFKHSAALGEAIAERLMDGGSRIPLDTFRLARFS